MPVIMALIFLMLINGWIAYRKNRSGLLWMSLGVFVPIVSMIILLCLSVKKRKKDVSRICAEVFIVFLLIVVPLVIMQLHVERDINVRLYKQAIDEIEESIKKYKEDNEEYPDDVNSLVPYYLKNIPSPRCISEKKKRYTFFIQLGVDGKEYELDSRCGDNEN